MIGTVMSRMITYFGDDRKRIHHAMKVFSFSAALWSEEARDKGLAPDDKRRVSLLLAAILHDIGIREAERKYGSCSGRYQELEGPAVARKILSDAHVPDDLSDRVIFLVGHHHTYSAIDDLDFQILVEADLFVNLEEDGYTAEMLHSVREKHMKTAGSVKLLAAYLAE